MKDVYFDNAATTMPYPEVADTLKEFMTNDYGNPSSLHKMGLNASKALKDAETQILKVLNLKERKVIYTSGATESTNLAIKGILEKLDDYTKAKIITSTIEHPCVSEVFRYYKNKGVDSVFVGVNRFGKIDEEKLYQEITPNTKLISLIWVNNEFGTIQNISSVIKKIKAVDNKILVHIDAVQGFGKVTDDLSEADMISISAHKFHGPKGIGALIIKKKVILFPQMLGGGQQDNFRSGTVNAPLIAAMAKSCEILNEHPSSDKIAEMQKYIYDKLCESFGKDIFNTHLYESDYAPHILNLSFDKLKGEVLLHMLEEDDIYVSTASACSAHHKDYPSVLKEIGVSRERIQGTIRISISEFNTIEQADYLLEKLIEAVKKLRLIRR